MRWGCLDALRIQFDEPPLDFTDDHAGQKLTRLAHVFVVYRAGLGNGSKELIHEHDRVCPIPITISRRTKLIRGSSSESAKSVPDNLSTAHEAPIVRPSG